jgi:hypothetical protein
MSNDSRLDKIRGLLAKAEASTFAEEAEAYTAKATELISKWGLEDALREAKQQDRPSITDKIIKMEGSYQREKGLLLELVARGLGNRAIQRVGTKPHQVHVFGTETDIVRIELLFTSLLVQASQGLASAEPYRYGESIKAYRRSWLDGFAKTIYARLQEVHERSATEAGPGTDLVLADRSALVNQRVAVFYPSVKSIKRRLTGSGRREGALAGARANLSTGEGQVHNDSQRPAVTR